MNATTLAQGPLAHHLECRAANWWRRDHHSPTAMTATEEEKSEYRLRVLEAIDQFQALSALEQSRLQQILDMRRIVGKSLLMADVTRFQRLGWIRAKVEEEVGSDGERAIICTLTDKGLAATGFGSQPHLVRAGEAWA